MSKTKESEKTFRRISAKLWDASDLKKEVEQRFRTPKGGGQNTDPTMKLKRLIRLKPKTLKRLARISEHLSNMQPKRKITPMQVASILLERAIDELEISLPAKTTKRKK